MPNVYPFEAIQYHGGKGDASLLVAPPYDVLDAKAKQHLLAKHERNIVAIDLPHVPAKELGPQESYDAANTTLQLWLREGTLKRRDRPAMFAYRQTFQFGGRERRRSGMACAVEIVPFGPRSGGGILPHEETFSGPKADRMALMKATKAQLSPIFGLHSDDRGDAASILQRITDSRTPDMTAHTPFDDVRHEVWAVDDKPTLDAYTHAMLGEDIFIADGHHRYTTALNYLAERTADHPLPPAHPARRCMFVLVSMADRGLVIGPTHRVLGGMSAFSMPAFTEAARGLLNIQPGPGDPRRLEEAMFSAAPTMDPGQSTNVLGLIDFTTGKTAVAVLQAIDPLRKKFPDKPKAWRDLDVALVQHAIVDDICRVKLNAGEPVRWAFPHSVDEALDIGKGRETGAGGGAGFVPQLAIIVRPTPLEAVRAIGKANTLMPQKSTFFYPKLATGLFVHGVE